MPYLGLCLGLHVLVIEFARNVAGLKNANSAEFDKMTDFPVIDLMSEQKGLDRLGGTMRLGLYPCSLQKETLAQSLYDQEEIEERHRHRYEVNNEYRQVLQDKVWSFLGFLLMDYWRKLWK